MIRFISKVFATLFALTFVLVVAAAGGAIFVFYKYGRDLPAYAQLADYKPPTMTRVHAGDGRLLTEYAEQPRVFVQHARHGQKFAAKRRVHHFPTSGQKLPADQ